MPFVLDNSVSVGWLIESQQTDYSEAVAIALESDYAHVPSLWVLEITNVLRTACRRERLTAAVAQSMLRELGALPITVAPSVPIGSEVLALALRHDLSSYDAAYLDLALKLQLPIATSDAALQSAAIASGVGVWRAPDNGMSPHATT